MRLWVGRGTYLALGNDRPRPSKRGICELIGRTVKVIDRNGTPFDTCEVLDVDYRAGFVKLGGLGQTFWKSLDSIGAMYDINQKM